MRTRQSRMSSFSQWQDDQNNDSPNNNNNTNSAGNGGLSNLSFGGIFGGEDGDGSMTLPLFNDGSIPSDFGWGNLKSSMEAQMPQKVLGMNYQERFRMFCALLILSVVFFTLGFTVGLPLIAVRPRKFALCFTCGSLTFMGSFAILRGPHAHFSGMFASDRLPFTVIYIGSMLATMYFTFKSHGLSGYMMVVASSAFQLLSLVWYLITFLPGGAQGMKILTSAIITMLKPIIVGCTKCWGTLMMKLVSSFSR